MGHTCSKNAGTLEGHALESDPRNRRNRQTRSSKSRISKEGNCSVRGGVSKWDPPLYALQQQSMNLQHASPGQHHLLFKQQKSARRRRSSFSENDEEEEEKPVESEENLATRLIVRRHAVRAAEEGLSGTHIYAIRWPRDTPLQLTARLEQSPANREGKKEEITKEADTPGPVAAPSPPPTKTITNKNNATMSVDQLFHPSTLAVSPSKEVTDWVTVSEEHNIYVADVGLTNAECNTMVQVTEQVCRGQYAAYTYAKQTLGCREFPFLAQAVHDAVHRITHGILTRHPRKLQLDDREPHMVKYDVTKKERQKLDMHTDKSEWTFLVSLSNGSGMDYEGGGTYFECLDATIHVQRGHAVIFPGKLRHCGQRITSGLRFLLVGFLVDKSNNAATVPSSTPDDDFPTALQLTNVP